MDHKLLLRYLSESGYQWLNERYFVKTIDEAKNKMKAYYKTTSDMAKGLSAKKGKDYNFIFDFECSCSEWNAELENYSESLVKGNL